MSEHVFDDAELYALGLLDDAERDRIEAHLATCGECSRAVGEAERVTLAIDALGRPAKSNVPALRPPAAAWLATAASLAIAVGLGGTLANQNAQIAIAQKNDDTVLATIATSHFLHASFVPKSPSVYPAKVLYARDAAWMYVIVDGPADNWRVTGTSEAAVSDVAMLHARGRTAVAFARPGQRLTDLQLLDPAGETVATVRLTYPRATP